MQEALCGTELAGHHLSKIQFSSVVGFTEVEWLYSALSEQKQIHLHRTQQPAQKQREYTISHHYHLDLHQIASWYVFVLQKKGAVLSTCFP